MKKKNGGLDPLSWLAMKNGLVMGYTQLSWLAMTKYFSWPPLGRTWILRVHLRTFRVHIYENLRTFVSTLSLHVRGPFGTPGALPIGPWRWRGINAIQVELVVTLISYQEEVDDGQEEVNDDKQKDENGQNEVYSKIFLYFVIIFQLL